VDYRAVPQDDGTIVREPVTVIDRVEEALRQNGFIHDAAGRSGLAVETLRQWRAKGVRANADILAGRRRRADLDTHERRCAELATRMERAEADARLSLLAVTSALARGGLEVVHTTEKQNAGGDVLEKVVRTSRSLPDSHAATWLLAHRYPADFAGRVEVTGPDRGPIEVAVSPVDQLLNAINAVRERRDGVSSNGDTPAPAGNGAHG
jgi:hypothetical protein